MKLIEIVRESVPRERWEEHVREGYGDFVKIVVDLERGVIGLGGALHADAEQMLLDDGSRQEDLWGANIFMGRPYENRIEYTSLINIRPRAGNRSIVVEDEAIQKRMRTIIDRLLV